MNFPQTKTLLLTAALCTALTACGGGDDDAASNPATPSAAAFADCFAVTPGVAYTMAGDFAGKVLMVQEEFDGTVRPGMLDLSSAGERETAVYWSAEADGIRFWGQANYNNLDHSASSRNVYSSGFLVPLAMQAGQSVSLSYTETTTYLSDGRTSTQDYQEVFSFEGFETVTLGGKTFENVCRIKVVEPSNTEDGPSTLWYAKGFGLIHARHTNSAGTVLSESTLDTITAQP